jgi:type I restriction enzyme M protein
VTVEQAGLVRNRLLSRLELANLIRVRRATITTWATRHADFPQPVRSGNAEYYWLEEVAKWGDSRPIPGSELSPGEPSDTYGQRLRREAARSSAAQPSGSGASKETQRRCLDELLGSLASAVRRGPGSDAGYLALLMCLVFLRRCTSREWAELDRLITAAGAEPRPDALLCRIGDLADQALRERGVMPGARASIERLQPRSTDDLRKIVVKCAELDENAFDRLLCLFGAECRLATADSFTPEEVALLMARLVATDSAPTLPVYDPYLRGGELLRAVRQVRPPSDRVALQGVSPNANTQPFAGMSIVLHDDRLAEIRRDNGKPWNDTGGRKIAVGAVLLNPPFNGPVDADSPAEVWPFGIPPADKSDFAWLQHAVKCLAPGARAAVLMPRHAGAAKDHGQRDIRIRMVEAGSVEAIVMLPRRFFPVSTANVNLWIVRPKTDSPGPILFIDATRMVNKSKTGPILAPGAADRITELYQHRNGLAEGEQRQLLDGGRAVMAGPDAIRSAGFSLDPIDYLEEERSGHSGTRPECGTSGMSIWDRMEAFAKQLDEMRRVDEEIKRLISAAGPGTSAHGWERVPLWKICELKAGPSFTRLGIKERTDDGTVPVVMPRHLRNWRIATAAMDKVSVETARQLNDFRLVPGDILCVRSGAITDPAIVREQNEGWLYGTNLIRLRVKDPGQVDADYLLGFLSLPEVQEWIRGQSTRTATSSISTDSLGHLQVTCPPIGTQWDIGTVFSTFNAHVAMHQQISVDSTAMRASLGGRLIEGTLTVTP